MLEFVQSLRDAPVMNLFVLVGFLLVVFGAAGKSPFGRIDVAGRILSAFCGVGLLGAATMMYLGIRSAREALPEDRPPPGGGTRVVEPALPPPSRVPAALPAPAPPIPAPAPEVAVAAAPSGTVARGQARRSPPAVFRPAPTPGPAATAPPNRETGLLDVESRASWGCQETKSVAASLNLPEGAGFRSAVIEVVDVERAKSFRRLEPRYDPSTRTVSGAVEFQGLDKVFFNCPGG